MCLLYTAQVFFMSIGPFITSPSTINDYLNLKTKQNKKQKHLKYTSHEYNSGLAVTIYLYCLFVPVI